MDDVTYTSKYIEIFKNKKEEQMKTFEEVVKEIRLNPMVTGEIEGVVVIDKKRWEEVFGAYKSFRMVRYLLEEYAKGIEIEGVTYTSKGGDVDESL